MVVKIKMIKRITKPKKLLVGLHELVHRES